MKRSATNPQQDNATLEHLLGVVVENREQRCAQVREEAQAQVSEIIRQAHQRNRASMHRHIVALREKYRLRVSAALARNETRIRKQHHIQDQAVLDAAWPLLHQAMVAQWQQAQSRRAWIEAAIGIAAATLLEHDWHIEHPAALDEDDRQWLQQRVARNGSKAHTLSANEAIAAGIRISAHGTVIDATVEGLLQHRRAIEARVLAGIKRGDSGDD